MVERVYVTLIFIFYDRAITSLAALWLISRMLQCRQLGKEVKSLFCLSAVCTCVYTHLMYVE